MAIAGEPVLEADPRRWITLAIVVTAVLISALDATILNVAIPTILRELHTTLPSLQWVISGYSLTFATFLIIGGRLGDIYGARRLFVIGASLFGVGSLVASVAGSVPTLVLGEAVVEGLGASLMIPATLAILSNSFRGHERGTAFAVWGATAGVAVALGPVLGGFLTTEYSWRWGFRINVVVAPVAVAGALRFMRPPPRSDVRQRVDAIGAALIATGTFCLVFALSEGATYGWLAPLRAFTVGGREVWPQHAPASVVALAFVVAALLLGSFFVVERAKERACADPLFPFGQLHTKSFRYGLVTTMVLAMGQLGFLFVLPVFLQDAKHLSALENGLWLVPSGICIVLGAQVGGRLTRRVGPTVVVRFGLGLEAVGLGAMALAIGPGLTFWTLLPSFVAFGAGIGMASSQLTNVVLSEIAPERSGSASGANATARQIGAALGIAVIGPLLSTRSTAAALRLAGRAPVAAPLRAQLAVAIRHAGVSAAAPATASPSDAAVVRHLLERAVASGARPALLFATGIVTVGAALSFLIPRVGSAAPTDRSAELADALATYDLVDVEAPHP